MHEPRLLVLGAHPDDAEFHAGGLITRYCRRDRTVKIVSVTNGAAGHHQLAASELHQRRSDEAAAVAEKMGLQYEVWEFPDGELQPTLEVRRRIIRTIRTFQPDLVLTHRTCDYHPDHRAVGQAVQDASFTVTVPALVPDTPALREDPVVAYMADFFTRPAPLEPHVVLDIGPEFDTVVDMLACHHSQVFEWLPYNLRMDPVPDDTDARRQWLAAWFGRRAAGVTERFRGALQAAYGAERAARIAYAEAYEISEYAGTLDASRRAQLFPE